MTQTNYGEMDLVIDDRTGRARRVRGGGIVHNSPKKGSSLVVVPRSKREASNPFDSKLEASRSHYLGFMVLAKDVRYVVHHPFTIQLSEKRSYTPDFLIEFPDGRIQVEEVKGHLKMKNVRDSITRLHLAAAKLPMFDWRLTMRIRGQWEEKCIPTSL